MKFSKKHWGAFIALFSLILVGFILANYDFAQIGKEEPKSIPKVKYLGSVSMKSSLIELVPEKDKQMIGLKERWLDSKANLGRYARLAVSENGKYKVVGTDPDQKSEGVVKATFIDTNGAEIWNAVVGYVIYVSNNGRNISGANPLGDRVAFYDVRTSTEPVTTTKVDGKYTFSYNGEYFISAGSKLFLRRSDGTLIWSKDTGTEAYKMVAISADGSNIVMASSGEPEPTLTDVAESQVEQEEFHRSPGKLVGEELRETVAEERARLWHEALEKQSAQGMEDVKSSQEASSPWWEKKVYLSFLRRDGTLTGQTSVKLRQAQNLVISDDGHCVALSCDSTLLFYETEIESLLWRKTFPTVYWWMKSMAVSWNGEIIALGVRPDRGDRYSPPHLYLLSKDGSEMGNFQLESSPSKESLPPLHYEWGPMVTFTEDEGHILVATYTTKYLFRIAEVSR